MRMLWIVLLTVSSVCAQDLFQAIRNNELPVLRQAIAQKADLTVRDRRGATLLMHAAAYGSPDAMRLLLDAGADVNTRNSFDATALLWAAGDAGKVRLLLDKGADVKAVSRHGQTVLVAACLYPGNAASVRMLLDKGADVKAPGGPIGMTPLAAAVGAADMEIVKLLLERGADVKQADKGGGTALAGAAGMLNLEMVKLFLAKGADVNAGNFFSGEVKNGKLALTNLTPLVLASPFGSPELLRVLMDAGAKVNVADGRGETPLSLAVATERQNPATIRLLLKSGADVNAKNKVGQTPLDWARIFGNKEVIAIIEKAGGKPGDPFTPPNRGAGETVDAKTALSRSVALLERVNSKFFMNSGCAACHHQNLAQLALQAAGNAGVATNRTVFDDLGKVVRGGFQQFGEILPERVDLPSVDIATYGLLGMAATGYKPDIVTDTAVNYVAATQFPDGGWNFFGITRPPIEESNIQRAAMGMRVIQLFGYPGRKAEFDTRIAKARAFLERAKPVTTDDHVWLALGLHWANASQPAAQRAGKALLKHQRPDGGWAQNAWSASDAYATGETLWALREIGGLKPADAAYQRGAKFLLQTQFADGSWFVRSRAPKFQPYFESGFPYGHDQWISSSATAWATAALAPLAAGSSSPSAGQ